MLWRFLAATGVFAAVGPAIGGIAAWTMMGASRFSSPLPFITGAYGEGIVLALGTGMLAAGAALSLRTTSWLVPIVATLLINAVAFIVTAGVNFSDAEDIERLWRVARVFLPPSLLASVVCWLPARRLLRVHDAASPGA